MRHALRHLYLPSFEQTLALASLRHLNRVALIRQERFYVAIDNFVLNAAKDQDLLEARVVGDHAHTVVADVCKAVRVVGVLDFDPDLLVKQEQVHVVQKRARVLLAERIVAATSHNNGAVHGQVGHSVAEARAWS